MRRRNLTAPEDLSGLSFGKWTVIERALDDGVRRQKWRCRCACGVIRDVPRYRLLRGKSQGCFVCRNPSKAVDDLTGKRFGSWIVLRLESVNSARARHWFCRCDCGKEEVVRGATLTKGAAVGCSTCRYAIRRQTAFDAYWRRASLGAFVRGLDFTITPTFVLELLEKQGSRCALSGLPIAFAASTKDQSKGGTTASLDRIDPSGGYTEINVQWVHKDINLIKWKLSPQYFLTLCKLVAEHASKTR